MRLAGLWETEFGKKVRRQAGKELALADLEAVKRLGVPLKSIERATLIWRSWHVAFSPDGGRLANCGKGHPVGSGAARDRAGNELIWKLVHQ